MEPTLHDGDHVLAVRRRHVERGDVVVIERPGGPGFELIKRVTAVGGDQIEGRTLRHGELWITGDAPGASTDSRSFGPLRHEAVAGLVIARTWPFPLRLIRSQEDGMIHSVPLPGTTSRTS
jgi:signal peptidase I